MADPNLEFAFGPQFYGCVAIHYYERFKTGEEIITLVDSPKLAEQKELLLQNVHFGKKSSQSFKIIPATNPVPKEQPMSDDTKNAVPVAVPQINLKLVMQYETHLSSKHSF